MNIIDIILNGWRRDSPQRTYLGASAIGDPCTRAAWMSWRHYAYPEFDHRMEKLLDHGHSEEARHIDGMRRAGLKYRGSHAFAAPLTGSFADILTEVDVCEHHEQFDEFLLDQEAMIFFTE